MSTTRDGRPSEEISSTKIRRPYGIACTTCRRAKMKCIKSVLEVHRCDRCVRLKKDCVYESHRRGLWRREQMEKRLRESHTLPSGDFDSGPSSGDVAGTGDNQGHLARQLLGGSYGNSFSENHEIVSGSTSPDELPQSQSESNTASFIPPSFITHWEDTRGLSLGIALDPEKGLLKGSSHSDQSFSFSSSRKIPWGGHDPVELRLISRPSAQYLFEGFFKHFNCLVGLLDPDLYTFSYTREASSLLFSTILAISARVFQPESYKAIRRHSETLLGQALLACDTAVENIWAIVCMYHWKDVDDTRGYTLVGFALRMAASAKWNKIRGTFMSGNETLSTLQIEVQVRQRRDKARVWLALGNLDRTSSLFTDLPLAAQTVNKEVAARSWLSLEKWTYPLGDGKAVGGYELTQIARPVYEAMMKSRDDVGSFPTTASFHLFQRDIEALNMGLIEWGEYWRPTFLEFPNSEPFQVHLIYFFRDYMRLYFNSVLLHRLLIAHDNNSLGGDVGKTVQLCFACASSVLQQVIEMGKLDILYYLWDTAHLMTGYSAMMILKLFKQSKHLSPASTQEALEVLAEASQIYSTAAGSLRTIESESPQLLRGKPPKSNPVAVQARLLVAIYEHLRAECHLDEQRGTSRNNFIPNASSKGQHQSGYTTIPQEETTYNDYVSTSTVDSANSTNLTTPQDMDFIIDSDFMDSLFMDAGLLSWDQPGIFIEPR